MTTNEAAELLRDVAAKRREYITRITPGDSRIIERNNELLEIQAVTLEQAAQLVEGDIEPLFSLLPSWHWTDEMVKQLGIGS